MVQPAGYIRIIAEELMEQDDPITGEVVACIEHLAVGLPLVDLLQPALGDPDEGIEPEEAPHKLDNEAFDRMEVADMARLVAKHHLAPLPLIASPQKDRAQEREGGCHLRVLGQRIAGAGRKPRTAAQAADTVQPDDKQPQRQQGFPTAAG